jgi:hypothetical protein
VCLLAVMSSSGKLKLAEPGSGKRKEQKGEGCVAGT